MTARRASRGAAVHRRFADRPGAGYLASGYALDGLDRWVGRRRPARVLEVGAGIGTTTAVLIEALDRARVPLGDIDQPRHVAVERVPFCLDQMAANLGGDRDRVVVRDWPAEVPPGPYDLVCIDGLDPHDGDPDVTRERSDLETARAVSDLARRAVVIVENKRDRQRAVVEASSRPGWVSAWIRPWDGTPGYHLYLFDPTVGERVGLSIRRAADRLWHPRGIRIVRHLVIRVTGRELRTRPDVASGEDQPSR